jgi:ferredoxin
MPKTLAQGKTIKRVGAKRLVLGHGGAFPTPDNCFEQVCNRLLDRSKPDSVRFGLCRDNCGAKLQKTLQQNSIDLYNGGAKVLNCCSVGSYSTCAVKVESEVSAANWRDKTRRTLPSPFSYNSPAFSPSS